MAPESTYECPLWVNNGHQRMSAQCPLYPRKRTLAERIRMSAKCQKQTSALVCVMSALPPNNGHPSEHEQKGPFPEPVRSRRARTKFLKGRLRGKNRGDCCTVCRQSGGRVSTHLKNRGNCCDFCCPHVP